MKLPGDMFNERKHTLPASLCFLLTEGKWGGLDRSSVLAEMILQREASCTAEKQNRSLGALNKGAPALRHFPLDTNIKKK